MQLWPTSITPGSNEHGLDRVSWTVERAGPFTGAGGVDWTSVELMDLGGLRGVMRNGSRAVYVVGSAIGPVNADGRPLSFPPIHIHHLHVINGPIEDGYDRPPVIEVHGDSACPEAEGGTDCLVRILPRGTGYRFDRALTVDFDLNDVRAPGSAPLEFWIEVALGWTTTAPERLATKVSFANPVQRTGPGVYGIPAGKSAVSWFDHRYRLEGNFVGGQQVLHSHVSRVDSLW